MGLFPRNYLFLSNIVVKYLKLDFLKKKIICGAGEIAQWLKAPTVLPLRTLAALAEDQISIPSIHK